MVSLASTLNAAYDITESRPWWNVRLTAIGLTVGLAFFILLSMTLIIAGPTIAERIADAVGLGPAFTIAWKILKWPVVFALIAKAMALVYYVAPDAEQRPNDPVLSLRLDPAGLPARHQTVDDGLDLVGGRVARGAEPVGRERVAELAQLSLGRGRRSLHDLRPEGTGAELRVLV